MLTIIEEGKKYVLQDGQIVTAINLRKNWDGVSVVDFEYMNDGIKEINCVWASSEKSSYLGQSSRHMSNYDIVAEYKERAETQLSLFDE